MKPMTTLQSYHYMVKHPTHCVKCIDEDFKETGIEAYQINKDKKNIDVITRGEKITIVFNYCIFKNKKFIEQ